MKKIRIGSRGSKLALWQAEYIKSELERRDPHLSVTIEKIRTTGDKILDVPLAKVGGKGLFVKEIEEALLDNRIDIAVHSMKDVPVAIPSGLSIGAITKREDPRDVLIARDNRELFHLPDGARIGTSSLRRVSQLLFLRPDLRISPLRGNIDTRLRKLDSGNFDAIIVAAAGIHRMGWGERVTEFFPVDMIIPAIGQGALCIEWREDDKEVTNIIGELEHRDTSLPVRAERAFLRRLEGGCQVPLGAYAHIIDNYIEIEGFVASLDGKRMIKEKMTGHIDDPEDPGEKLAESILLQGGDNILKEIYGRSIE